MRAESRVQRVFDNDRVVLQTSRMNTHIARIHWVLNPGQSFFGVSRTPRVMIGNDLEHIISASVYASKTSGVFYRGPFIGCPLIIKLCRMSNKVVFTVVLSRGPTSSYRAVPIPNCSNVQEARDYPEICTK